MSLTLLHQLAQAQLPVNLFSGEEIDQLRVLQLAGHVKAVIPLPARTLSGFDQPPATVSAITPLGAQMLKRFPQDKFQGRGRERAAMATSGRRLVGGF